MAGEPISPPEHLSPLFPRDYTLNPQDIVEKNLNKNKESIT